MGKRIEEEKRIEDMQPFELALYLRGKPVSVQLLVIERWGFAHYHRGHRDGLAGESAVFSH